MYYIYVLQSLKDRKLYIGYTPNLESRVKKHNRKEVRSTKSRAPFELIYYEAYKNREDATKREKYYKTGWGRTHLRRILACYFKKTGLPD